MPDSLGSLMKLEGIRGQLALATDLDEILRIRDTAEAVRAYVKAAHLGREIANDAAVIKIAAERKAGQLLKTMAESGERDNGRGGDRKSQLQSATVRLIDLGLEKTQSSRWQRIGEIDEAVFAVYVSETQAQPDADVTTAGFLRYVGSGAMLAGKHTGEMEWYTPTEYIEAARKVLSEIDLDPASCDQAQQTVKAARYYTLETDGLAAEWSGRVFLNPPYKMSAIRDFVFRLCDSYEAGTVTAAILLTNDNTDTQWWQRACRCACLICLCAGRLSFYNAAGEWSAPTNGQTFFYFGPDKQAFRDVFGDYGTILSNV